MPLQITQERIKELVKSCKPLFITTFHPEPSPESFLTFAIDRAITETLVFPPADYSKPGEVVPVPEESTPTSTLILPSQYLSLDEQSKLKSYWSECLLDLLTKYETAQTPEVFESDVTAVYKKLFLAFPPALRNPDGAYRYGLKWISVQVSVALWLKQLWCIGSIPTPPACPLSTNVLMLCTRYPDLQLWNHVNSPEEYRERIRVVEEEAGEEGIAKWELLQQLALHHLEVSGQLGVNSPTPPEPFRIINHPPL
jgi:hypothetical protein